MSDKTPNNSTVSSDLRSIPADKRSKEAKKLNKPPVYKTARMTAESHIEREIKKFKIGWTDKCNPNLKNKGLDLARTASEIFFNQSDSTESVLQEIRLHIEALKRMKQAKGAAGFVMSTVFVELTPEDTSQRPTLEDFMIDE